MDRIGIVGAGNVGSALARRLVALGHNVVIANSRGPESLQQVAKLTGAVPVQVQQAIENSDVLIIAIPMLGIEGLSVLFHRAKLRPRIVVDTCNYYPNRDGKISEIKGGMPESLWVSTQLGTSVVKAFNSLMAAYIESEKERITSEKIALPVAADDESKKAFVSSLVEELGFATYDAGTLQDSWRQQPGQPVYCTNPTRGEIGRLLARADKVKAAKNRDTGEKLAMKLPKGFPSDRMLRVARLSAGLDRAKFATWFALLSMAIAVISKRQSRNSSRELFRRDPQIEGSER